MQPALSTLIDRIESQRTHILNAFRSMSSEQLNQSPAPGKWSAAEILSHIITAERMSVIYMQKKLLGIEQAATSGLWEEIKIFVLKVSQRLPGLRFRAPQRVVENTIPLRDHAAISGEWEKVRKDLRKLVEQLPENASRRMIYKHPVAGYLNIRHALIFFHEHIYHHAPQLKRLLK